MLLTLKLKPLKPLPPAEDSDNESDDYGNAQTGLVQTAAAVVNAENADANAGTDEVVA